MSDYEKDWQECCAQLAATREQLDLATLALERIAAASNTAADLAQAVLEEMGGAR